MPHLDARLLLPDRPAQPRKIRPPDEALLQKPEETFLHRQIRPLRRDRRTSLIRRAPAFPTILRHRNPPPPFLHYTIFYTNLYITV